MKRHLLTPVIAIAVALAFVMNFAACANPEGQQPAEQPKKEEAKSNAPAPAADQKPSGPKDDFVVSVNGEKLMNAEVDNMLKSQLDAIAQQVPPEQLEQVKKQLDGMKDKWRQQLSDYFVQKTVLAQEADKKGIKITDDEVNAQFKEYEQQAPPGTKLEDMLKQQGITMEKLRADIKNILKAKKLMDQEVKVAAVPSDDEIKKYYEVNKSKFDEPEKVKARHILIKSGSADNDTLKKTKKAKAEDIRKKLAGGADFAKLAKESSDCPSKEKGGDLGYFSKGQMVKPFEEAAFSLKVNDISAVVETQFGYHIIQVQEHTQAKSKSVDDVKADIVKSLQDQNKQKAIKEYIDGLVKKATVVYGKN